MMEKEIHKEGKKKKEETTGAFPPDYDEVVQKSSSFKKDKKPQGKREEMRATSAKKLEGKVTEREEEKRG